MKLVKQKTVGLSGGSVVKSPPANAEDMVQPLVQEDTTCRGATKPIHQNSRACERLGALTTEPHAPRACVPQQKKPPQRQSSPRSPRLVKSLRRNEDPAQPKIKILI